MNVDILHNEQQIIYEISEGNEQSFEKLFNFYSPKIFSFILAQTKSVYLAEEIVQQIFLKLWTMREELINIENFKGYINRMTANNLYNYFKKIANDKKLKKQFIENVQWSENVIESIITAKETNEKILATIKSLPAQRKNIFMLSRYLNLTHSEIADHLKIAKSTVNNQINQALKQLTEVMRSILIW